MAKPRLKHVRELLVRLPGWRLAGPTGSGHWAMRHDATGARMTVASSPGDWRTVNAILCTAKRAVREAQERQRA